MLKGRSNSLWAVTGIDISQDSGVFRAPDQVRAARVAGSRLQASQAARDGNGREVLATSAPVSKRPQ